MIEQLVGKFPISRDPPEGGTLRHRRVADDELCRFQFLGIPPKGELVAIRSPRLSNDRFPISRDPPEGGTNPSSVTRATRKFPWVSNF